MARWSSRVGSRADGEHRSILVAFSYGYDRLRFIKPVFIGDTIRASATIKEKRDHPRRASHGIVVELLEVSNQDTENVLVCEHLYLVERRESVPHP